jgi:hypothetical protein
MKTRIHKLLLLFVLLGILAQPIRSQPPPPPGDHGSEQNENPFQQAPIGSGLIILLTLAAGYACIRTFRTEVKEPKNPLP